jgi:hypothetical protein
LSKIIDPEEIPSAISSWSGFVYQGKVALYHALTLLNTSKASASYTLQLDSLEDFAVLDQNDIVSIHQVKALKSTHYSTYKSPFEKLCKKATAYGGVDAYFHTARAISDKSVADIASDHPEMKIYSYGAKSYCQLERIDELITLAVAEFHSNNKPAFIGGEYAVKTRHYLDALVQGKVILIHSKIHSGLYSENAGAFKEVIHFQELIDVLSEDAIAKSVSPNYFLHLTRIDLNNYYQEFCCNLPEDTVEDCCLKLNNFAAFLNALSEEELVKFIRKIIPHRMFVLDRISDYKNNNIQQDEIKQAFLRCLKELREISPLTGNMGFGWLVDTQIFVPTSINSIQDYDQEVCGKIMENILKTDLDLPFETSALITANISVTSIYESAAHIMDIDDEEMERESEKVTNWKRIALVSLADAKLKIL